MFRSRGLATLRHDPRAAPPTAPGTAAVVGVSLAALAAGTFSTVGIGALAPELQLDLGLSRAEIGVLTALVSLGASITSRRAGALTDSIGPLRVLAGALVVFAAAFAVGAAAPAAPVLMAAMFVGGLGYGGTNPPTNVVIAGQMTRRLGLFMSVKQTGVPVGGFLAGLVMPPVALALSWRWAFALGALVTLVVAGSTVLIRGAAVLEGRHREEGGAGLARRERIVISLYGAVMAGIQWAFLTYLVLYLTDSRDWSLRSAGLALSLATVFSVGGRLFWGWLSDRSGRRLPVLIGASAISIATLSVLAAGVPGVVLWPVAAITGAALVGWNGVFHALIADRAGPGAIGRVSGEVMSFVFAGSVCLPPLLGFASQELDSWTLLWAIAAALVGVAGLGLWSGLRRSSARRA